MMMGLLWFVGGMVFVVVCQVAALVWVAYDEERTHQKYLQERRDSFRWLD